MVIYIVREEGRMIVDETNPIKYSYELLRLPYEKGLPDVIKLIKAFMKITDGDVLFLGNGSIELVRRQDKKLTYRNNPEYYFEFPFHFHYLED